MKKFVALLLAAMMLLLTVSALAEVVTIEGTSLQLDIGDMEVQDMDDDDFDEDCVLWLVNDDDTLECMIYVYDAEGAATEDLEELMSDMEGVTASGFTTINGVDTFFQVVTDDEEQYVLYYIIDDDMCAEIIFWYADDTAAQQSGEIMATITR